MYFNSVKFLFLFRIESVHKSKITKIPNSVENSKQEVKWQNPKLKHIKRMENNFVQAFPYAANGGLNLFL